MLSQQVPQARHKAGSSKVGGGGRAGVGNGRNVVRWSGRMLDGEDELLLAHLTLLSDSL